MADISLRMSGLSVTCVSNAFIDHFMANATGEYVKIYIYLLRCLEQEGEAFSVGKIAAKLGHTDLDVKRAFDYWEQQGMVRQERDEFGELTGICVLDPLTQGYSATAPMSAQRPITISSAHAPVASAPVMTSPVDPVTPAMVMSTPVDPVTPAMVMPTPQVSTPIIPVPETPVVSPRSGLRESNAGDISSFADDEEFSDLLFLAETYSGHTLSPKDIDRILFWYDGLGMPADLVEYLITYCADKGHSNLSYMNKIALSWADAGIDSVEAAKAETSRHSVLYYAVCTGFGISGRNLTPAELEYIGRWENMFSDADIIREACKRTILKTGKISFNYADKILSDWHEHGINAVSDIGAYDQAFAEKLSKKHRQPVGHRMPARDGFHNFTERDYDDMDAIEAKLLAKGRR